MTIACPTDVGKLTISSVYQWLAPYILAESADAIGRHSRKNDVDCKNVMAFARSRGTG
ncbi:hypothetical protein PP1Y_AT4506 [Novosphingobium sp. PP1Y]|jgi:hypothetical protein|nr:hypothetical protein PP1Y_AT4506 [Novosphingobium sp. PP1Y]